MAAETATFSATGETAIARTLDIQPDITANQLSAEEFDHYYDIQRTADEIEQGNYKRIALQFPDELLHHSVPIFRRLKSKIDPDKDLYVLADTSYGSCCVDEVAAQHVNADAMVHYGHACMSLTSRLPVLYAFGKKKLDVDQCVSALLSAYKSHISDSRPRIALLRHEVAYSYLTDQLRERLQAAFEPLNVIIHYTKLKIKSTPTDPPPSNPSVDYSIIFYIGSESLTLTNLLMTNAFCDVFSYDPLTNISKLESGKTNKMLMRRYAIVQKARDADVFGILVGTLGVASYLPLIKYLRNLLSSHQKKSYTISVGKLTPSKLANFLEIECFVIVACPENSLIETKEFLKPIVTPFELEIALKEKTSWTGRYVLDFDRVIQEANARVSEESNEKEREGEEEEDPDQPVFSLVTGKYRHAKRYGGKPTEPQPTSSLGEVVLRNQDNALAKLDDSAAAQFLQTRSYKGLEVRLGEDAPSILEQGRSGIAKGYQTDYGTTSNTEQS